MTQANEPLCIYVYRKKTQLFVQPFVLSTTSVRGLRTLIAVKDASDASDLQQALEEATRVAKEVMAKPLADRFPSTGYKELDYSAANASTWEEFVHGATAVVFERSSEGATLAFHVQRGDGLVPSILREKLGAKAPMAKVAAAVVDMFERASREKPRIATRKDLESD